MTSRLDSLISELDKLNTGKLETTPIDLEKLSDAVKNEVVKKTVYDELVKKVNADQTNDTSDLVKRAGYNTKIKQIGNNKQVWVDARWHSNEKDHFKPKAKATTPKLQQCAISTEANDATLRKWQKNLILDPILVCLTQIRALFFAGFNSSSTYYLDIVPSYHLMRFKERLMNQTCKNVNKPYFWPDFGPDLVAWLLPLLDVRNCCKLLLYAMLRKTNERNLRKWKKT